MAGKGPSIIETRREEIFPILTAAEIALVIMSAPQERNFIEHMFLEPFEPEIDHGSHEQRDHLREDQSADDNQTQRPA